MSFPFTRAPTRARMASLSRSSSSMAATAAVSKRSRNRMARPTSATVRPTVRKQIAVTVQYETDRASWPTVRINDAWSAIARPASDPRRKLGRGQPACGVGEQAWIGAPEEDLPGLLVGNTEFQRARAAVLDRSERLGHDRPLDAAARDRADELAALVHREVAALRPGR